MASWKKRMRDERREEMKRYYRYCVEHTTDANARNYTRMRFGVSYEMVNLLAQEIEREDRQSELEDNDESFN